MRLTFILVGAIAATLPFAAVASTLEMRINGDDALRYIDNGPGDDDGRPDFLTVSAGAVSGYEVVSANVVRQTAPPFDRLLADVGVEKPEGGPATIRIEVTGHFRNNSAGLWPGSFSATADDVLGSAWDITTYIGNAAYDQGDGAIIGVSNDGSLFAVSNLIRFNPNNYWITHVFTHDADGDEVVASANADFLAPVPVPAAGLLLIGALGGLAAMRRRAG
jgi:hypothetical protein